MLILIRFVYYFLVCRVCVCGRALRVGEFVCARVFSAIECGTMDLIASLGLRNVEQWFYLNNRKVESKKWTVFAGVLSSVPFYSFLLTGGRLPRSQDSLHQAGSLCLPEYHSKTGRVHCSQYLLSPSVRACVRGWCVHAWACACVCVRVRACMCFI